MPAIVNIKDFFVVGLMAYLFIVLFNKALKAGGMGTYTTGGEA